MTALTNSAALTFNRMQFMSRSTKLRYSGYKLLFRFRTQFASHQRLYGGSNRLVLVDDVVNLPADGHFHLQAPRHIVDGPRRGHSFHDLMNDSLCLGQRLAPSQRDAEAAVAGLIVGAGEHQVA